MHVYIFMRNNNAHKADQEHGRRDRDGVSHLARQVERLRCKNQSGAQANWHFLAAAGRPLTLDV